MAFWFYQCSFAISFTILLFGILLIFSYSNRYPKLNIIGMKGEMDGQTFKPFQDGNNGSWWCNDKYKRLMDKMPDPYYKRVEVNASEYEGYVRQDWPPERSLDLKDYIGMKNSIIMDFEECINLHLDKREWKAKTTLMMMLHSDPSKGGEEVRNVNRNTWMKDLKDYPHIFVVYIIGRVDDLNQQAKLEQEQKEHCDLLQFNFKDSYSNVTIKTGHMLQYFYRNTWDPDHGPPQFLMRGDDDVYFDLVNLDTHLKDYPSKQGEDCDEMPAGKGHVLQGGSDFGFFRVVRSDMLDKLLAPNYLVDDQIPHYFFGAGVLIPRWAAGCMALAIFKIPIFFIDDIYLGWAYHACEMGLINVPGWDPVFGIPKLEHPDFASYVNNDSVIYHFNWGKLNGRVKSKPIIHQRLKEIRGKAIG